MNKEEGRLIKKSIKENLEWQEEEQAIAQAEKSKEEHQEAAKKRVEAAKKRAEASKPEN